MKLGVLFSGGKDSTLAAFLARQAGHELVCLLSVESSNKHSFMFHTPSIVNVVVQADAMDVPLLLQKTKGTKEKELVDLEKLIVKAKKKYNIEGIVTGAVSSVYQATRIQKVCNSLGLEVFNPLWQKNQGELLKNLLSFKFDVIVVGVFAYPLDKSWLGRTIDETFILETKKLHEKYGFNVAGEGGEFESFVLNCPLFRKPLTVLRYEDTVESEHAARREVLLR